LLPTRSIFLDISLRMQKALQQLICLLAVRLRIMGGKLLYHIVTRVVHELSGFNESRVGVESQVELLAAQGYVVASSCSRCSSTLRGRLQRVLPFSFRDIPVSFYSGNTTCHADRSHTLEIVLHCAAVDLLLICCCPGGLGVASAAAALDMLPAKTVQAASKLLKGLPPNTLPLVIARMTNRRGLGGRQPGADPRLDPSLDPKKAQRILSNRQSAARSKLMRKVLSEVSCVG
jgi:hypothetical protein